MASTDQETDDRPRERLVSESFKGPNSEERGEGTRGNIAIPLLCASYAIVHMTSPTRVSGKREALACGGSQRAT
jgi:hypothetical protein